MKMKKEVMKMKMKMKKKDKGRLRRKMKKIKMEMEQFLMEETLAKMETKLKTARLTRHTISRLTNVFRLQLFALSSNTTTKSFMNVLTKALFVRLARPMTLRRRFAFRFLS